MSPYEPVAIVPQNAIARGKRLRVLWFSGWALAIVSLIGSAFLGGQVLAYKNTAKELENGREEIKKLQAEQYRLTYQFAAAWQDQRNGIDLISTWASHIKDRDELITYNKLYAPVDLKKTFASKGK